MSGGHGHSHAPTSATPDRGLRNRLAMAFAITALVVVAQAIGALVTGSLALLLSLIHI